MSLNEQYESKISLLDQYARCLEKENEAKGNQINILHQSLAQMSKENDFIRTALHDMKEKLQIREKQRNISCSLQTSINLEEISDEAMVNDAFCQTRDQHEQEYAQQIKQILDLTEQIKIKDEAITRYHKEGQEMFMVIQKLEQQQADHQSKLISDREVIRKLEEQLRVEERKRLAAEEHLEEISDNIYNAGEESQHFNTQYIAMEEELTRMVTENNGLIERIRSLEREKNQYYHQLKRVSRVSFGAEGLSKSHLKQNAKVKDQRWKDIEQNLRRLQSQNEAIQSNLMINR